MSIDHDAEHQALEHAIDAGFRAQGDAIGRLHADVQEFRGETRANFEAIDRRFNRLEDKVGAVSDRLGRIERLLEERLPAPGDEA